MEAILGAAFGFISFTITSHPRSPLNKRIPSKKFKRFHFTPEMKLLFRNKFIHLHHWLIFIGVYGVILTVEKGFLQSDIFQGFVLGSIAQGLTYEDRFMVIYGANKKKVRGKKYLLPKLPK